MAMKELIVYIHGQGGTASEADRYADLFPRGEVIGFDYRAQTPWEAAEEFSEFFAAQRGRCDRLTLIANSIGAQFAMQALDGSTVDRAYFISPIVDMERLICGMMRRADVTERELAARSEIETEFGPTLSWRYLCYVREHPIEWRVPTCILYGENDRMTDAATVTAFAKQWHARLTVMPGGEHWFHTEEQLRFLDAWLVREEASAPIVCYARREELERVNVLREAVNALHAEGRPDIFRAGFCDELREVVFRAFDAPQYDVLVACVDGEICGFAIVQYVDRPQSAYMCARHMYHIEEFGVAEGYRRRGVGTALLAFCRAEAKRRGYERLELDVWSFNDAARKFYAAAGFRPYRCFMEAETDRV